MSLRFKPFILPLTATFALEIWCRTIGLGSDSIAAPTAAIRAFVQSVQDGSLLLNTSFTLFSAIAGLAVGSSIGLLAGVLLGLSSRSAHAFSFTLEMLRPVPSVALVPLFMLVFGFGYRMEIGTVAFATLWPMLVLSQAAIRQVDPRLMEVSRALELSSWRCFSQIIVPSIIPRIFVALRLGVALALVVAVTVEIAANPNGMGYAMSMAQQSLDPASMLAWLVWIGVVGYVVNLFALQLQGVVSRNLGEVQE